MNKILEISSRKSKGGRRKIEIVLHKIHEDDTEKNKNGIHWSEVNTRRNIASVSGIPICAEFTDDDKEIPLGHGYTATENIDGKETPLFENSEVVGVIEKGEIKNVEINGKNILALVGEGVLYEQRYPKFCKWVKTNFATSTVDTSIEIVGLEENENKIIYEEGGTDEFRIPKDYSYSGVAVLSVVPADDNAIVLECAQAKNQIKEEETMDEKELKTLITSAIAELNSEKVDAKVAELSSQLEAKDTVIAERDATIVELNATIAEVQKALDDLRKEQEGVWEERRILEEELGKLRAKQRIGELNEAVKEFSDEEKKYAEVEINAFNENPVDGNIEEIVSKIYAGIGQASKKADTEAKIAEINSAKELDTIDIFSEINSDNDADLEDVSIF